MFGVILTFRLPNLINSIGTDRRVEFQRLFKAFKAFKVTEFLKALASLLIAKAFSTRIVFAFLLVRSCFLAFY